MRHRIVSVNPFTVQYEKNGLVTRVQYKHYMTPMEIAQLYDTIKFDQPCLPINSSLYVLKYKNTTFLMEGRDIVMKLADHVKS